MKYLNKRRSLLMGLIVVITMLLCLLAIHANQFWVEFITIFNGIMMPLISMVNVYVFYKLTKIASEMDASRLKIDKERHDRELLMQFRNKELDLFDRISSSALLYEANDSSWHSMMLYIESFYTSKLPLFALKKDSVLAQNIKAFQDAICANYNKIQNGERIDSGVILDLLRQKNAIISTLQIDMLV